ncbi:MAG: hypothetical protein M5U28_40055 [Sandaracinaceae bacterium]|nr:hypothetical protein [Sandaracinaceae bacterium]
MPRSARCAAAASPTGPAPITAIGSASIDPPAFIVDLLLEKTPQPRRGRTNSLMADLPRARRIGTPDAVRLIGLDDLIANKRASGRPQDLADADALERARRERSTS